MRQFDNNVSICIEGYLFHKTCEAFPEQYDVYRGKKQVAYVRLRMGRLTVRVPDVSGKVVYYKNFEKEDPVKGYFDNDEERMEQLIEIVKILKRRHKNENKRRSNK